jgi:hypothetical protein
MSGPMLVHRHDGPRMEPAELLPGGARMLHGLGEGAGP